MTALVWDSLAERFYETGTDRGVLYVPTNGAYNNGYAWNGLYGVTESPTGAAAQKEYADNIAYLSLLSAEQFGGTIEAFTCPDQFWQFDGVQKTASGMKIGQQKRQGFGFSFRSKKGNAVDEDAGYILHLVYGCLAAPSDKAYKTINDTPAPVTFSWVLTTTPVAVTGYRPTSVVKIDTTDPLISPTSLAALELILYGTVGVNPRMPLPDEVNTILTSGVNLVTPTAPSYNSTTDIVTIPATTGVIYSVNGVDVPAGPFGPITANIVVNARPAPTYSFTGTFVTQWLIVFA